MYFTFRIYSLDHFIAGTDKRPEVSILRTGSLAREILFNVAGRRSLTF